jgi:ankyrin repeat protein
MREEGVEVDQLDMAGNTPLHLAARAGRTATAATLLNLGASVHVKVSYERLNPSFVPNVCTELNSLGGQSHEIKFA